MLKRNWLLTLLAIAGTWQGFTLPAASQALLPPTFDVDNETLENQGILMLQDAVQLVRFEQYELAMPRIKLATQLAPQEFRGWFLLGSLYVQQQEVDQGIEVLERALSLVPSGGAEERPSILFTLGSAYFQNEQYTDARRVFTEGLAKEDSAEAWFDLGNTHYQLRDASAAIAAYKKAIKLESQFWPAINNIGLVEYEQGKVDEAIEKWEEALKVEERAAEPILAIAVARYHQGQVAEAISLAEQALRIDPAYGDLEFLKINLWGDRLLQDTAQFFELPEIQGMLLQ